MLEEIHKNAVVDKIPWQGLHKFLRKQRWQRSLAGSCAAIVVIMIIIIIAVGIASPSGACTSAQAALQLRRGGIKIQAIARDHHD